MFTVESSAPIPIPAVTPEGVRASLTRALLAGAELVKAIWIRRAQQLGLRNTGADSYLAGIEDSSRIDVSYPEGTSDTIAVQVSLVNTSPEAKRIEEGHEAYHLPSKIKWPTKWTKTSKSGAMWLDVPLRYFAHASKAQAASQGLLAGTLKNMLPKDVYTEAKKLRRTLRMNVGPIYAADGRYLAKDRYTHEAGSTAPTRLSDKFGSKYKGLIKTGPKGHTEYLTIRRLTPTSPGWNIPAKEGMHIASQVAEVAGELVGPVIQEELSSMVGWDE